MKRLNPETGKPFIRGDIRDDGFIFLVYKKHRVKRNGYYSEDWYTPAAFERVNIKHAESVKARYDKRHKMLSTIKVKAGCKICGYNKHPSALDFDHRNPYEKSFDISAGKTLNLKKLMMEVAKCDILCANCHRERTHAT